MEPIFEAVLKGESEVGRLLRGHPALARTRAARDHLVDTIPHWLYAGDTSLHLAAAGLFIDVARLLLASAADPASPDAAGRTPVAWARNERVVNAMQSRRPG